MKSIILLLILLTILMSSPYMYKLYILKRQKEVDETRAYIYKHFIDLYIYLPSKNMMTYNLIHDTSINYWINECYREQKRNDSI